MANIDIIPYQVYERAANKVIEKLIQRYNELDMKASGKWAEGLEFVIEGNTIHIRGYKYTEQLVYGRKPGKNPPMEPLQKWFMTKYGIEQNRARGLAFGLQKKIAREGTSWHRMGGSNLLEYLTSKEAIEDYYGEIERELRFNVTEELKRQLSVINNGN